MHIPLPVAASRLAVLSISVALWGCTHPFDVVYCTAAGYPDHNCPPSEPAIPPPLSVTGPASPEKPSTVSIASPALPAAPPNAAAGNTSSPVTRPICPDTPDKNLYNLDANKNWIPTPCQKAVVTGAILHCVQVTQKTDNVTDIFTNLSEGSNALNALLLAGGTGLGAALGGTPAVIAPATALVSSFATNVGKVFTGTPPIPTPASMFTAASSYAQINQGITPPPNADYNDHPYYAGLWNAAGTACPPNLILGNFRSVNISLAKASNPGNFEETTPSSFTISFDPGKDTIDTTDKTKTAILDKIDKTYQQYATDPLVRVTVLGKETAQDRGFHSTTNYAYTRAEAVIDYLAHMEPTPIPGIAFASAPKNPGDATQDATASEVDVTVQHQ
jgi:hypothetical protein